MKKLHLKAQQLGATEVLSRAQLKNILGGTAQTVESAELGFHVCGRSYVNGQCLCDICYNYQPLPDRCGEPCMAGASQDYCIDGKW